MSTLGRVDVAKRGTFHAQLSHKVKPALVTLKDDLDLEAFVTECIRLNNSIRALGQESCSSHPPAAPKSATPREAWTFTPSFLTPEGSEPMDLSAKPLPPLAE